MSLECPRCKARDTANRPYTVDWFLRCVLFSVCLLLLPQAWASTISGDRYALNDAAAGFFGYDIDADGDRTAVGAWLNDGAVHIYERDSESVSSQWQLTASLPAPEESTGLQFGFNVWLQNDQLIVGAPNIFSTGIPGAALAGKAFIYERNSTTGDWALQATLSAGDQPEFSTFGREVVVDGDRAIVSVSPGGFLVGLELIVVYDRDSSNGTWSETAVINISDDEVNSVSVSDIVLADEQLIVAVEDIAASSEVRLFDYNVEAGVWIETGSLTPGSSEFASGSTLGLSLDRDMDGDALLVTDPSGTSYYLFQRDPSSGRWLYDPEFTAAITTLPNVLGKAAALDGDRVVLADANNVGADVYQRSETTGQWIQVAQLSLGADTGNDVTSVSFAGDNVWLGTPYTNGTQGSAIAYQLSDLLSDPDDDGVSEDDDNCPMVFNPDQSNFDDDLLGDACDLDDDNDGVDDDQDAFPFDNTRSQPEGSSTIPAVPEPSFPAGGQIRLETVFLWPNVTGAQYYVIEVQHEGSIRAYETMISADGGCGSGQCVYIKSDAAMMGSNRWRLRAGNNLGLSQWSAWTDFVVSLPADPATPGPIEVDSAFDMFPATPVPASPSGGGYAAGVKFQWAPVPGVIDYAIEIQHNALIRGWEPRLPASLTCTGDRCEFVMSDAALPGVNRWRLSARNDIGQTQWSDWVEFTVSEASSVAIATEPVPGKP